MGLLCQWWSGCWVWDSGDNYKGGGRGGLSSGGAGEQACTRWLCQVTDLHEIQKYLMGKFVSIYQMAVALRIGLFRALNNSGLFYVYGKSNSRVHYF